MAGNGNSGRNPTFHLSEKELAEKIKQYKESFQQNDDYKPSWQHFAAYLDCTERDLAEIMSLDGKRESAYCGRARMLKKMATWIRGEIVSSKKWGGPSSGKGCFALKQDVGDGVKWTDQESKQTGPVEVKILLGGNDPRAKDAAK